MCRSPEKCFPTNDTGIEYKAEMLGNEYKMYTPANCRSQPYIKVTYIQDPTLAVYLSLVCRGFPGNSSNDVTKLFIELLCFIAVWSICYKLASDAYKLFPLRYGYNDCHLLIAKRWQVEEGKRKSYYIFTAWNIIFYFLIVCFQNSLANHVDSWNVVSANTESAVLPRIICSIFHST